MNAPRDWTLLCLSCGAVVALSRLFSCSWVPVPGPGPGYLGTWVPGYLGTWVPGYLGTWAPGHLGVPVGPQGPAVGLRGPTVSPTVGPPRTPTKGSDISRTDCTVWPSTKTDRCVPLLMTQNQVSVTFKKKQVIAIGKKTGCAVELPSEKNIIYNTPAFCSSAGMLKRSSYAGPTGMPASETFKQWGCYLRPAPSARSRYWT